MHYGLFQPVHVFDLQRADDDSLHFPEAGRIALQQRLICGETRIWAKAESGTMIRARVTIAIPEADAL